MRGSLAIILAGLLVWAVLSVPTAVRLIRVRVKRRR